MAITLVFTALMWERLFPVLRTILYTIFWSPLFYLTKMTLFADDNYVLHRNKQKQALLLEMKITLETIIKWLKQSGLKVYDAKTEFCLFYPKDSSPVKLIVNNVELTSVKSMNVLWLKIELAISLATRNHKIKKSPSGNKDDQKTF